MADTQPELTLERFAALVEAYGGDVERFPERERALARALSLRSGEAHRMLEGARALDDLLVSARADTMRLRPVLLEEALERIPERFPQIRPPLVILPFRTPFRAALAAAAALLLGVFSERYVPATMLDDAEPGVRSEQADMGSLTFADDLFDELGASEGERE